MSNLNEANEKRVTRHVSMMESDNEEEERFTVDGF